MDIKSLEQFLIEFSPAKIAKKEDSQRIIDFFNQTPMNSDELQLSYHRHPNFFAFLELHSPDYFVFFTEDENKQVNSVATLLIREGFINGHIRRVGYLGDMRINPSRSISKIWKKGVGALIENIKNIQEFNCDEVYTVIMANNILAKRTLVKSPLNSFSYHKLANYQMVNILTKFVGKINPDYKVIRCKHINEILPFWVKENKKRQFGYTPEFIHLALKNWKTLKIENFLKVVHLINGKEEVIACCATWNPSPLKSIVIKKLPRFLKAINFIASFITTTPREKEELKIQYLNFLTITQGYEDCIDSVVAFLKREGIFKYHHMLAYAEFEQQNYSQYLKYCIVDKTALEYYQVYPKNNPRPLDLNHIPGLEISLV